MATTFTPSGTPATAPIGVPAQSGPMPAVDSGNLDTVVVANGAGQSAWITFAAGAQAGPGTPGSLELRPGVPVLLTNNAAVPTSPNVIRPDRGAGAATGCSVAGMLAGGSVTITRGTAVQTLTF